MILKQKHWHSSLFGLGDEDYERRLSCDSCGQQFIDSQYVAEC